MAADHDALSQRLRVACKVRDVFLSFRGEDTRHNFTSHLYQALIEKGIKTFIDNGLRRGEYVTELFSEIERSRICVVVFSINYAGSVWCLNELVKVIQDKEIVVLPIFYKVSPSDVRHQRGHVGNHFVSNEKIRNSGSELIGRWRNALTKLGNISGWEVKDLMTNEAEIIQQVVYKVSGILESLAAYNNYNRRIHIQPQTVNPTCNTLRTTQVDERGSFEKQWYGRIFGEASQLYNKPSAIPLRQTLLSAVASSSHNSESPVMRESLRTRIHRSSTELTTPSRNIGVSSSVSLSQRYESLLMTESQRTGQDQQANLSLRRASLGDVTVRRELGRLKYEVAELKKEVAKAKNYRKK